MSRKMIPVEECFVAWRKDPKYVEAYNALEDEFSLAEAMIHRIRSLATQTRALKFELGTAVSRTVTLKSPLGKNRR
jgi:hypothetical protein